VKISADNLEHTVVYTMQTEKIVLPSFTPVNLPWNGVNRLLDMQELCNQGACVIKRCLSNACLSDV